MKDWIPLTDEEKELFTKMVNKIPVGHPTFFNLPSDRNDVGGKFAEMTNEQVMQAAEDSAKWLMNS